jgi:hypothetical protein
MIRTLAAGAALAALAATGCSPANVGGEIDGERIGGARDAIYDTLGVDFGPFGEYELLVVILTDFSDACETYDAFYDAAGDEWDCDDRCERYLEIADEHHLGDAHWATVLSVNTSDGTTGEFDHDVELGEGEFSSEFNAYDTEPLHDAAACEAACEDGDLLAPDTDDSEDGTLELEERDEAIGGRFEVSFGGDDGLDGGFTARPCDMGDWLWPF